MHPRQISSSSFAEAFDAARSKLDELTLQEEDEPPSPSLSSSDSITSSEPSPLTDSEDCPLSPGSPLSTPIPATDDNVADDFAFAFDIDGVLIRGGRPIPEAIEAMKVLNGENEFGIKV